MGEMVARDVECGVGAKVCRVVGEVMGGCGCYKW